MKPPPARFTISAVRLKLHANHYSLFILIQQEPDLSQLNESWFHRYAGSGCLLRASGRRNTRTIMSLLVIMRLDCIDITIAQVIGRMNRRPGRLHEKGKK